MFNTMLAIASLYDPMKTAGTPKYNNSNEYKVEGGANFNIDV